MSPRATKTADPRTLEEWIFELFAVFHHLWAPLKSVATMG